MQPSNKKNIYIGERSEPRGPFRPEYLSARFAHRFFFSFFSQRGAQAIIIQLNARNSD